MLIKIFQLINRGGGGGGLQILLVFYMQVP